MNISHDYYDMIIDIINSVTDDDTWRHDGSELDELRGRIPRPLADEAFRSSTSMNFVLHSIRVFDFGFFRPPAM